MNLKDEQRSVVRRAVLGGVLCAVLLSGAYFLLPRFVELPVELTARFGFALKANIVPLLWVMLGVRLVARGRFHSEADIGGSAAGPPSPVLAVRSAFLQNTLEQAFLAAGANLALAATAGGAWLGLIVASVVLFSIGRLAFYVGYPHGAGARAFGMAVTAVPALVCLVGAVALGIAGLV